MPDKQRRLAQITGGESDMRTCNTVFGCWYQLLFYAFLTRLMCGPLNATTATMSWQADINNIEFDVGVQGNEF